MTEGRLAGHLPQVFVEILGLSQQIFLVLVRLQHHLVQLRIFALVKLNLSSCERSIIDQFVQSEKRGTARNVGHVQTILVRHLRITALIAPSQSLQLLLSPSSWEVWCVSAAAITHCSLLLPLSLLR